MTNPCEIGLTCPYKRCNEEGDYLCVYPCGTIVPEDGVFSAIEEVLECPLVDRDSPLEDFLFAYADCNGNIAIINRGGWRMSTEPEPTMIWLSKDDFARLKEDLRGIFEGTDRKGVQSCFYPESPDDLICDDGKTVQLKIDAYWRRGEGWVHLKSRTGKGKATRVYCYGKLCGCSLLPTGE